MLKSVLGFPDNIVLDPNLFLMMPFCVNYFLEWIIHSTSDLVMSFVYILYCIDCVVQRAPWLMVYMDLLMMGMCCTFSHMFKLAGLMCYLKPFNLIRDTHLCWGLFIFTCWWLFSILWLFCPVSFKWNFLMWGKWSWMIFYGGKALCSYNKK